MVLIIIFFFTYNLFSVRNVCFWFQKRKCSQHRDFPQDGNSGPSILFHEGLLFITRKCRLVPSLVQAPKVPNHQKLSELTIKVKSRGQQMDGDRWRTTKRPGDTTGQPDNNHLSGFPFSSHSDLADLSSLCCL